MYLFTPPIAYQRPYSERSPFWSRVTIAVPYTVVKTTSGGYRQEVEHDPDLADIAVVYEGGHVFVVDDAEAAQLTAAGYGSSVSPVDP